MGLFSENTFVDVLYWIMIIVVVVAVGVGSYYAGQKNSSKNSNPDSDSTSGTIEPEPHPGNTPIFHPVIPVDPSPTPTPTPSPTPTPTPTPTPPETFNPVLTLIKATSDSSQGNIDIQYKITANTKLPSDAFTDVWFNVLANGKPWSTDKDMLKVTLFNDMLDGRVRTASADTFSYGNIIKGAKLTVEGQVHTNIANDNGVIIFTKPVGNKSVIKIT
jgi:hypothetical protein